MAKARQLAAVQPAQSWALLAPLGFLQLLVGVNLGITLGVLPQLVRMLTGYESSFSRSGTFFASNPLFFLLVIAVSWIAFDPFVQAVYCVRCFRAESLETGEDLRSGLRRIAAGVPALALLLLFALAPHASAVVTPGDLEKSVQQTMQSHEYDWRLPPRAGTPSRGLMAGAAGRPDPRRDEDGLGGHRQRVSPADGVDQGQRAGPTAGWRAARRGIALESLCGDRRGVVDRSA